MNMPGVPKPTDIRVSRSEALEDEKLTDPVIHCSGFQPSLYIKSSGQPLKHKMPEPHPRDSSVFDPVQGSSSAKLQEFPKFILMHSLCEKDWYRKNINPQLLWIHHMQDDIQGAVVTMAMKMVMVFLERSSKYQKIVPGTEYTFKVIC